MFSSGLTGGWLGKAWSALSHTLFLVVTARGRERTIFDALDNRRWVSDLKGALTLDVIFEYLQLWDFLENYELQPDLEDTHF